MSYTIDNILVRKQKTLLLIGQIISSGFMEMNQPWNQFCLFSVVQS